MVIGGFCCVTNDTQNPTGCTIYLDDIVFEDTSTNVDVVDKPVQGDFSLIQNYPNPFNSSTTIAFNLRSKSFVSLKIFDALGKEVATLVSEELPAGTYTRQWSAVNMPSGVYFNRLQTGSFTETKKLILQR